MSLKRFDPSMNDSIFATYEKLVDISLGITIETSPENDGIIRNALKALSLFQDSCFLDEYPVTKGAFVGVFVTRVECIFDQYMSVNSVIGPKTIELVNLLRTIFESIQDDKNQKYGAWANNHINEQTQFWINELLMLFPNVNIKD